MRIYIVYNYSELCCGAVPAATEMEKEEEFKPPRESQLFRVGMKLEARDYQNLPMTGVATIADIQQQKLLIHFDGWPDKHDYWCHPDSTDIHPIGWCREGERTLQPPKDYGREFSWDLYLSSNGFVAVPDYLFTKAQRKFKEFTVGMKLEAKNCQSPTLTCVATITDILENLKLLIHLDGWSSKSDYWCDPRGTDIHPAGWCENNGHELQQPKGHDGVFEWKAYLRKTDSVAAPISLFTKVQSSKQSV